MQDGERAKHLQVRASKAGLLESLSASMKLLRVVLTSSHKRSDLVYTALADRHAFGDDTLFFNLGYWKEAHTLDDACVAMADLLADAAAFRPGHDILDVGFGFADQDIHWARTRGPLKLRGLNITPIQVEIGRERVERAGLADQIDLQVGDAVATPFEDASFDRVVALECAFHFCTRRDFFDEAFRVLRPGGRLAVVDFIARAGAERPSMKTRLTRMMGARAWQIPEYNLYGVEAYRDGLQAAGFDAVHTELISEHVFEHFCNFQRPRFDTPEFKTRYQTIIRWMAMLQIDSGFLDTLDYILATADKPAA